MDQHSTEVQVPWVDMLPDILAVVSKKLPLKYIPRLRAVCPTWYESISNLPPSTSSPWLVIPKASGFQSLHLNTDVSFQVHMFAETNGTRCVGYQDGWLALINNKNQACLYNPITGSQVNLPPFAGSMHISSIRKIAFRSRPDARSKGILAVAIICGTNVASSPSLAFAIARRMQWNLPPCYSYVKDVDYSSEFKSFFVSTSEGLLYRIRVNRVPHELFENYLIYYCCFLIPQMYNRELYKNYNTYLVTTSNKIVYQVLRKINTNNNDERISTEDIRVTRWFHMRPRQQWQPVGKFALQNYAFFIGNNVSISLKANDYPGIRPNCVYLIDSRRDVNSMRQESTQSHDVVVFDVTTKRIEHFTSCASMQNGSLPFWFFSSAIQKGKKHNRKF